MLTLKGKMTGKSRKLALKWDALSKILLKFNVSFRHWWNLHLIKESGLLLTYICCLLLHNIYVKVSYFHYTSMLCQRSTSFLIHQIKYLVGLWIKSILFGPRKGQPPLYKMRSKKDTQILIPYRAHTHPSLNITTFL